MKNKKAIGILLSFALLLGAAIPGTLAVQAGTDSSEDSFLLNENPSVNEENLTEEGPFDETPIEDEETTVDPESQCTCVTGEDGSRIYTEGCPVHEAPAAEPVCTCVIHEDGSLTYTEGCPVHEAPAPSEPEQPAHIEGCSDECTEENCPCPCHALSLFDRLMAAATEDEFFAIVDAASEEELSALTEEQNAQLDAHLAAIEIPPLPPVELEECVNESVISEIVYPAVNFDNVAPFGAPVVG